MGEEVERCTSYGRGGFGNMRRPSTREQAKEALATMADTVTPQRRRSSTWSMTSNGERRNSAWKNLFRRQSAVDEPEKIEE